VTFKVYDIKFDGKSCKLVIMKDITYQCKLNEAESKAQRVKTLTSSVSNNARSPLTSISMLCEFLIRKIKNPETNHMIKTIYSASKLSNFIMQDLLDNQLVEQGHFKLNFIQFNVKTEIEELFKILGPQAQIYNNYFKVEFEHNFRQNVVSDKSRM
jgi:signal transduction histidine kinase